MLLLLTGEDVKKPPKAKNDARVEHFLFGAGTALRVREIDSGLCADVAFDEGKPRTILLPWLKGISGGTYKGASR